MSEAIVVQCGEYIDWKADADYSAGAVVQVPDGRAGIVTVDILSGKQVGVDVTVGRIYKVLKTASIVMLPGGRVFWDHSANKAHFKQVADRDFYMGVVLEDTAGSSTTVKVALNVPQRCDRDLMVNSAKSVIVGTAAAGGFGYPVGHGGARQLRLTATNEAQKVDIFGDDGFATGSLPIIEAIIQVVDNDASTAADLNIGIASATHATDGDAIAQHVFAHVDGNDLSIWLQSKDGTTTVAAADSTVDLVLNTPKEIWFDCRNTADVQIYIDGILMLTATVFKTVGSAVAWYLLAHLEKTATTDTADYRIGRLVARFNQNVAAAPL